LKEGVDLVRFFSFERAPGGNGYVEGRRGIMNGKSIGYFSNPNYRQLYRPA
jgi:hypothetical protein